MNGYVEAGYVVVLGTLATYSSALVARERAARARARDRTRSTAKGATAGVVSDQVSAGPGTEK
jgi:hypothetical protein